MSSRAEKLELLQKSLKKHFSISDSKTERNVLEVLLYACCLEDTSQELADEAFAKLQQTYFDWNEVRVTTLIELGEVLSSLPNPAAASSRIKKCLQSLYESRYQYDIDDLKKANLSKATEDIQAWEGITPFVLNYVSQQALGGHAIPFGTIALNALIELEIITPAEAEKKSVPGAERAIPKTKGYEFGELLHTFAYEFANNPKNPAVAAVFKDLGVVFKAPAAPSKKKEAPPADAPKASTKSSKSDKEAAAPQAAESAAKQKVTKQKPSKAEATAEPEAAPKTTKSLDKAPAKSPAKNAAKPKSDKAKADTDAKGSDSEGASGTKKPAKLANNVKMTKKKPK